jgi:hypothetical protein
MEPHPPANRTPVSGARSLGRGPATSRTRVAERLRARHESILVLRYADDGTLGTAPGDTGIDLVDLGSSYAVRAAVFPAAEGAVFVAGAHDHRLFVAKVRDRGAQLDTESFERALKDRGAADREDRGTPCVMSAR